VTNKYQAESVTKRTWAELCPPPLQKETLPPHSEKHSYSCIILRHVAVIVTFPGHCPASSLTSLYETTATKLSNYTWIWLGALVLVNDGISCPLFQTSYPGITKSKNIYATIPKESFMKWYFYIRKLQTFHLRNAKSKTHTIAFWNSSTTQIKNFKLNCIWKVWQHKQFRQQFVQLLALTSQTATHSQWLQSDISMNWTWCAWWT
jgi:hypothetical protein